MMRFGLRWREIQAWIRDYDRIQSLAVKLIHFQIGCSLIGSLGAFYNGALLVNLAVSLFALVAIESSSQSLGRTYAVLLLCSILLDVAWFILFSHEIWFYDFFISLPSSIVKTGLACLVDNSIPFHKSNIAGHISSEIYGTFVILSVKLTLTMQIIGFSVRLSSSLLWIQMYRMGASYIDNSAPRETDVDLRNSFLNPATPIVRRPSGSDDVIGGAIYDPAYYSSLFEDGRDDASLLGGGQNHGIATVESPSSAEISRLNPSMSRSYRIEDGDNAARKLQIV